LENNNKDKREKVKERKSSSKIKIKPELFSSILFDPQESSMPSSL
jgi:hypothetical protein